MKDQVLKASGLVLVIFASLAWSPDHQGACIAMPDPPPTTTAPEKPVEQVFKNIKVLRGMPQSQLFPAMFFISTSLGRQCEFCHVVRNGELDSAADDKPEKAAARQMMTMVRAIRQRYIPNNPEISCYTCHRGQTSPAGVPPVPLSLLSAPAPLPTGANEITTQGPISQIPSNLSSQLSVGEIFDRNITAIGGKKTAELVRNCVMKGTMANSRTRPLAYEIDQVLPDTGYETEGVIERSTNGPMGWITGPEGVLSLEGQQVADEKLPFPMFVILRLREQYVGSRYAGQEAIEGRGVYVVSATRSDGKRERLYFDMETGFLRRRRSFIDTMIGAIPQQTDCEDYRRVEIVRLPFRIRVSTMDFTDPMITKTFDEIRLDVSVDESKLSPPNSAKTPRLVGCESGCAC